MTYFSASTICGKPVVPSFSAVGVSTSRMRAPGAIACAYSTSRLVSPAQPSRLLFRPVWRHLAGWLDDGQSWRRRQPGGLVKDGQVAGDGRRSVGVHDHDGLAAAGNAPAVESREAVSLLDLRRQVARDLVMLLAVRGRGRRPQRARHVPGVRSYGDRGRARGVRGAGQRNAAEQAGGDKRGSSRSRRTDKAHVISLVGRPESVTGAGSQSQSLLAGPRGTEGTVSGLCPGSVVPLG